MIRLERYIFRQAAGAFLLTLSALIGVLYITQALRELDLVTSKGQTLWLFMTMTALWMPMLIMIIAPVALLIAAVYVLNKLNGDSELVVMTSAGLSRWRIVKPFLVLTLLVSGLIAVIALDLSPRSLKLMRHYITQIRADLVGNVLRAGRFSEIEAGLVFHVRERTVDGRLIGIMVNDDRDKETTFTYLAKSGRILQTPAGSFLVMFDGSIQRLTRKTGAIDIVRYERYAFDLSKFGGDKENGFYKPRERMTSELFNPDPEDAYYKHSPGRVRVELHDRFSNPLYPLAFIFIVLAALGRARTTRQARGGAILAAGVLAGATRLAGFYFTNLAVKEPAAILLMYAIPLGAIAISIGLMASGIEPRLPRALANALNDAADFLRPVLRRFLPGPARMDAMAEGARR